MEMQNLIAVETRPAVMSVNFDELKSALATELEKYNVVVTADTVADAKKLATELNATKKMIDDRRKAEVAQASEPVKHFDSQMKELMQMCTDGRQQIVDQVKRFEDETRAQCGTYLGMFLDTLNEKYGIKPEFQRARFDDIAQKLTSMTPGGKLAKSAKDDLENRVRDDKSLQDQTERRLLELEKRSYQAELAAPLTRDHVLPFLYADDATYEREIARIISIEVERQEQAEARMRRQMEKEQERRQEVPPQAAPVTTPQQEVTNSQPQATESQPVHEEIEPPREPLPDGRIPYRVTCEFEVNVKPSVPTNAIKAELRRLIEEKAGITTMKSITVEALAVNQQATAA